MKDAAASSLDAGLKRGQRAVGEHVARFGLEHPHEALRRAKVEPAHELVPVEDLGLDAFSGECPLRARLEVVHELDDPGETEQRLAALCLELAPACERLLGEADPLLLGVGQPKDPLAPVARAPCVPLRELLVDDDVAAPRAREPRPSPAHSLQRRQHPRRPRLVAPRAVGGRGWGGDRPVA